MAYQELGINMTTAVTIFAKKMTREKRIPFEVSVELFYSESNMAHKKYGLTRHRKIDDINRLVYRVNGDVLEIVSCKGHYEN